jgi:hypothetical protein
VLVISDRLWRWRFGANPSAVGRMITMNDRQSTIGVLFVVALVAQVVPIVRAMRVDPAIALRQEWQVA